MNAPESETLSTAGKDDPTALVDVAEREALQLLQSASNEAPQEAIKSLTSALNRLASHPNWPLTRQPYPQLRDQLILSYLATNNFSAAFIHAAIRYLRVDPVLYSPAHPIRHLHAWILAKLAIYLSQSFETSPLDPVRLEDYGINFHFVLWYVLADLASRQMESCTVPGFRRLVGANFGQVNEQFQAQGIDLSKNPQAKGMLAEAWKKLEKVVEVALERE